MQVPIPRKVCTLIRKLIFHESRRKWRLLTSVCPSRRRKLKRCWDFLFIQLISSKIMCTYVSYLYNYRYMFLFLTRNKHIIIDSSLYLTMYLIMSLQFLSNNIIR